ncbi:hypothetical protein ACKWTF_007225 [Chironomus riparius]
MENQGKYFPHFQNFYFSATKDIYSLAVCMSLPTLQFDVLRRVLDNSSLTTENGRSFRKLIIESGALDVVLNCLNIFTHSNSDLDAQLTQNSNNSLKKPGIAFWNADQALQKQKYEERFIMIIFKVLSCYINPKDRCIKLDPENFDFPQIFVDTLKESCLIPVLCSYLRNDSVLDIMKKVELYGAVFNLLQAIASSSSLSKLLTLKHEYDSATIKSLINSMQDCIANYVSRLQSTCLDDEIKTLQSNLIITNNCIKEASNIENISNQMNQIKILERPISLAEKYVEVMKEIQFDLYEMIEETIYGFKFTVPYFLDRPLRLYDDSGHSGRYKRLAQESATLSKCLPLSFNSSIFIRQDSDRMDVMKCLITGPSNTPYANGCFEFDVYFPPNYPNTPVLMAYKTVTQSDQFINPNLYNNGLICLSILNTWQGSQESRWQPQKSTLMEVLIAIQTNVFVSEPYFNEPAYEKIRGTEKGDLESKYYTCSTYISSIKYAIIQQICNPSPCFKDVIYTHFWLKRNEICEQVQKWIKNAESNSKNSERAAEFLAISEMLTVQYQELKNILSMLPTPQNLKDFDNKFVVKN